jgi:hypothetical protein
MASGQDLTTTALDPSLMPTRENQDAFSSRPSVAIVLGCISFSYAATAAATGDLPARLPPRPPGARALSDGTLGGMGGLEGARAMGGAHYIRARSEQVLPENDKNESRASLGRGKNPSDQA